MSFSMFVRVNAVNIGLLFVHMFQGETIVRNNSVDQAVDYRDGMAKVCCHFFLQTVSPKKECVCGN